MIRWFTQNLGNIFLSVLLALTVWVVAVNDANPNHVELFRSIPIEFINLPPNMELLDRSATTVDVTVNAPESAFTTLNSRVISATVDLSQPDATDGVYEVKVSVPDASAHVTSIRPASVRAQLDRTDTIQMPIDVTLIGEPALGYQLGRIISDTGVVTVTGPVSWVGQVARIGGEFNIQGLRSPISDTITLRPFDSEGGLVSNVELDPDSVLMSINVNRDDDFRDLSVKVEYTGTVASGYSIAAVEVMPQIIQVTGPKSALEQLEGFVSTEVINIDQAQADVVRDALLMVPEGVTPRGQQLVKVTIKIEPIQGSLTLPTAPIIVGLQANLNARISPEMIDVLLVGALPVLDRVNLQEEIRVILDLSELGIGTHQVEPRVEAPDGIMAQSLTPPTIQVIIERGPPRTPTPTATPTN